MAKSVCKLFHALILHCCNVALSFKKYFFNSLYCTFLWLVLYEVQGFETSVLWYNTVCWS